MAALEDITRLREAMKDVSEIEAELGRESSAVSSRSLELKSAVKKRLSAPSMLEVIRILKNYLCPCAQPTRSQ